MVRLWLIGAIIRERKTRWIEMPRSKPKQSSAANRRVATSDDIEVSTYLEIAREISGEQTAVTKEETMAFPKMSQDVRALVCPP